MMEIRLNNNDGYLEWIFLDGKKTIASKITGCSYGWFIGNYPDYQRIQKDFFHLYSQEKNIISKKILVGIRYKLLEPNIIITQIERIKEINKKITQDKEWERITEKRVELRKKYNELERSMNLTQPEEKKITQKLNESLRQIEPEKENYNTILYKFTETFFELQQYISSTGYINATSKLVSLTDSYQQCDEKTYLNYLYYGDIDQIDGHRLGGYNMLLSIKSFQREDEMVEYTNEAFQKKLDKLIQDKQIDTIIIVPNNTSKRIAYNEYISQKIHTYISDKDIHIVPYNDIKVNDFPGRKAQKSIKGGICERINNADQLFDCKKITHGINILLIDDAFGSGATMNMIAKKIKKNLPDSTIIGLSIIGSMRKGFDVLSEV